MTPASSKVLVTGADGFIGTELCRQLIAAGYNLVRLTRARGANSGAADEAIARADAGEGHGTDEGQTANKGHSANEFGTQDFSGDIRDRELLQRALTGVQVVFHLAGIAHVDGPERLHLQAVNVEGTTNLAEAAVAAGVGKLVYFSSSLAANAERDDPRQTDYGHSKLAAEQSLLQIASRSALKVVILRPVNVYGPGMKGNLAAMIRLIRRRRIPPLPGLETRLSLIGLNDLCRAAILAATSPRADNRIYYITDGETYLLNDIEAAIYQAVGRNKPDFHSPRLLFYLAAAAAGLPARIGLGRGSLSLRTYQNLVADNLFSNQPVCDELGFIPEQTFYTALPDLIQ